MRPHSLIALALAAAVLVYAALAGCYTLKNFDLGWQLATGRYIVQTGQLPRYDMFSYTAAGKEWIYPVGAPLLFYLLYSLAGYPALNLLGMLACVAVVALLLLANLPRVEPAGPARFRWARFDLTKLNLGTLWLVALAVPTIAGRTSARADLFTTVLFAAVLVLLWRFHLGLLDRLYLLPFLFVIWANLHQGFIFGLALFFALLSAKIAICRDSRLQLRRLLCWFGACALTVLVNPWGWRLYTSLWRVRQDMAFQRGFIGEASGVPVGWWSLGELLRLHDPDSSFWMLAAAAVAGVVVAAARRQVLSALLLAGAIYIGFQYVRAQVLLVITAAVVLPVVFGGLAFARFRAASRVLAAGASALLLLVVTLRSADLVSNRYYIARGDIATFGFGVSWWFPERALNFIEREKLPGRLYHDYNLGGWVMWRLWPRYPVYIDGRVSPFTPDIFLEQQALITAAPDSPQWQAFLDRWGINTLLISLARYQGYRVSPAALCAAPEFRLVYLDEVSGVWVRSKPQNPAWLERLASNAGPCLGAPLPLSPPADEPPAKRYNFLANAALLYRSFGRAAEALKAYKEAERLFPEDANLRLSVAQIWQSLGRMEEARQEFRHSLAQRESPQAWHSLGLLEAAQGRYREAAAAFAHAAERAALPHESYRMLGESYLALREPHQALWAFETARATSRYRGQSAGLGREFFAAVEEGQQRARKMLQPRKDD